MNDCLFCKIINGDIPSKKIYESEFVIAFLDINPKETGHTLVVPKTHIDDIYQINSNDLENIRKDYFKVIEILKTKLNASGFTIATNVGSAQEIKHLHIHIIPKYDKELKLTVDEVYNKIKED